MEAFGRKGSSLGRFPADRAVTLESSTCLHSFALECREHGRLGWPGAGRRGARPDRTRGLKDGLSHGQSRPSPSGPWCEQALVGELVACRPVPCVGVAAPVAARCWATVRFSGLAASLGFPS